MRFFLLKRTRCVVRNVVDMGLFQKAIEDCDLEDLGFSGPKLTWDNRHKGNANIHEQLDRFVVCSSWRSLFRRAKVCTLKFWG